MSLLTRSYGVSGGGLFPEALASSTNFLRVDSRNSPPPLSFPLSGSYGGRRVDGLGGWLLSLYRVVVEVAVSFWLYACVPTWSRSPVSIGRIWGARCLIFLEKLLWWQEWWIGGRSELGISNNKAVLSSSSQHLAVSSSSGGCSLEMLRDAFYPWWMERQRRGSEGDSLNKLDLPFKMFDLELSICGLAAMEVGGDAEGCFFDWQVLKESGGDFVAASSPFFIPAVVCCCSADGAADGSSSSTAYLPPIFQAERRLLPPSLLEKDDQHKGSINLRYWRPCYLAVVGSRYGDPSGVVPGVAVVGHGEARRRGGNGAGPDCVFCCNSEVRDAKHKGLVEISFFCKVLHMYCIASAGY